MDLRWLAGLVDGEGCFSIHVAERNHHGHHLTFQARFVISMKSGPWFNYVAGILNEGTVVFHHSERKGQTSIAIEGWRQTQKLGRMLVSYSIVKKPLIQKILEYKPATNNRFPAVADVQKRSEILDFVRNFNKGKNRPSKWTGSMIMKFYGY